MEELLKEFNIPLRCTDTVTGPSTTKIYLKATKPFKLNKILGLEKELSMFLKTDKVNINLEGEYVTVTIPNKTRTFPKNKPNKTDSDKLTVDIGKAYNENIKINIAEMPHIIIAGTTGSGKSVLLRNIMNQLNNYTFIDGKTNELEEASEMLDQFVDMMERRYKYFTEYEKSFKMQRGSCDIDFWNSHHKLETSKLIKHVVIIDEFADLSMQDKALNYRVRYNIENKIIRLMQKARAAGIHVILTTQRPDAKTLSGLIRANAPARIALKVANKTESRIILDKPGAEKLLGKGDMIVQYPGKEIRCQGYAG